MNNTDHHPHSSSRSPHAILDHLACPEYSPSHSENYPDHTSTTSSSPHTAPLVFNSSPYQQLGHTQMAIPTPSPQSSALSVSMTVPEADDDAKYETSMSTPLTMLNPQHSLTTPAHTYPPSPAPPAFHVDQRKHFENVSSVDTVPTYEKEHKKRSDGNTFLQNVRNPRKKTFWAAIIVFLAIVFGVLGATVWKPNSNTSDKLACTAACTTAYNQCIGFCVDDNYGHVDTASSCFPTCLHDVQSCAQGC